MNCLETTTVWILAYEILSTGLFTFCQCYSQPSTSGKINAANGLRMFALPAWPAAQAAGTALVDKFSAAFRQKQPEIASKRCQSYKKDRWPASFFEVTGLLRGVIKLGCKCVCIFIPILKTWPDWPKLRRASRPVPSWKTFCRGFFSAFRSWPPCEGRPWSPSASIIRP
jgi:hypothetical protein